MKSKTTQITFLILSLTSPLDASSSSDQDFTQHLQQIHSSLSACRLSQKANTLHRSPTVDGWNYGKARSKLNPFNALFWEFKYFNFHSADISGNITFMTAAPSVNPKMIAIAHMYTSAEIQVYKKVFDFGCVRASRDSAHLALCDGGGIDVLAPNRYKISLRIGPAEWQLEVVGERTNDNVKHVNLDGWLPWEMFWRPVFVGGSVNGTIRISDGNGAKEFVLQNTPAYHDQNWGYWNPSRQPYRWLQFSGQDSSGQEIDILMGDFYKNRSEPASELILQTPQVTRQFRKDEFRFNTLKWGRSESLRFGFDDKDQFVNIRPRRDSFDRGDHSIPTRFAITSTDGTLSIIAQTILNDASGSKVPDWLSPFFKDFVIDEQMIYLTVEYRTPSGELRHTQGVGGFQTINE